MLFRAAQVCMFCGNHLGNTCYIARAMIAEVCCGLEYRMGSGPGHRRRWLRTERRKMTAVVYVFHPNLAGSVVNRALAGAVAELDDVLVRNMYAQYPDYAIDVEAEHELIEGADAVVLQFPLYWYSTPSLMKKWLDDILTEGWAYGEGGTRLRGKKVMLALSAEVDEKYYCTGGGLEGAVGFEISQLLSPLEATMRFVGMEWLTPFRTFGTMHISKERVAERAREYADAVRELAG